MPYDTLLVLRWPPVHQSTVSENRTALEDVTACMLGSIIVAAVRTVVTITRRTYAGQRQRQRASAI
jgi:VanZ family protein